MCCVHVCVCSLNYYSLDHAVLLSFRGLPVRILRNGDLCCGGGSVGLVCAVCGSICTYCMLNTV